MFCITFTNSASIPGLQYRVCVTFLHPRMHHSIHRSSIANCGAEELSFASQVVSRAAFLFWGVLGGPWPPRHPVHQVAGRESALHAQARCSAPPQHPVKYTPVDRLQRVHDTFLDLRKSDAHPAVPRYLTKVLHRCVIFPNDNNIINKKKQNMKFRDFESIIQLLNKFDVFTEIRVTPEDLLLSQKIYTAINRKRAKGRDFYDITFLFSKTKPDYGFIKQKMGIESPEKLRAEFLKRIEDYNFEALAEDVAPFLISQVQVQRVRKFKEFWKQVALV